MFKEFFASIKADMEAGCEWLAKEMSMRDIEPLKPPNRRHAPEANQYKKPQQTNPADSGNRRPASEADQKTKPATSETPESNCDEDRRHRHDADDVFPGDSYGSDYGYSSGYSGDGDD
jgi:hypothetical protein